MEPKTTPLQNRHDTYGRIKDTDLAGFSTPAPYGDPASEYTALTQNAALVDRSYRTLLRLIGNPIGMLDAILTNEVPKSGSVGAYAALLNPKGRIQTDLRVLKWGEDILVDTEPEGADPAREILGRYAPFSRVLVEDLSADVAPWGILGLYGPRAGNLLGNLNLAEHETTEIEVGEETLLVTGVAVPVPGFDLIGPVDTLRAAMKHLTLAGAVPAGLSAHETARV